MIFEEWWEKWGQFIDPDTSDVPFGDKVEEIAGMAFEAGRQSVLKEMEMKDED